MRDKEGNKVSTKEFMTRWKRGIESITPLQQAKVSLIGNIFVIVGVVIGLVTTFIMEVWWLFIILVGSFLLTAMGLISGLQKYFALKRINKMMEGGLPNE